MMVRLPSPEETPTFRTEGERTVSPAGVRGRFRQKPKTQAIVARCKIADAPKKPSGLPARMKSSEDPAGWTIPRQYYLKF